MGFNVISCDFMMIFDDFMGFNADLMWFNEIFMGYSWDIHGIFRVWEILNGQLTTVDP